MNNRLEKENPNANHWTEWSSSDYCIVVDDNGDKCGINYKCPGCGAIVGIANKTHADLPGWNINYETLTATPSILHTLPDGCGWHGYLTNGELKSC